TPPDRCSIFLNVQPWQDLPSSIFIHSDPASQQPAAHNGAWPTRAGDAVIIRTNPLNQPRSRAENPTQIRSRPIQQPQQRPRPILITIRAADPTSEHTTSGREWASFSFVSSSNLRTQHQIHQGSNRPGLHRQMAGQQFVQKPSLVGSRTPLRQSSNLASYQATISVTGSITITGRCPKSCRPILPKSPRAISIYEFGNPISMAAINDKSMARWATLRSQAPPSRP
ncbi:hypothetical protein ACLOJK_022684, partial [Asimina triloba]